MDSIIRFFMPTSLNHFAAYYLHFHSINQFLCLLIASLSESMALLGYTYSIINLFTNRLQYLWFMAHGSRLMAKEGQPGPGDMGARHAPLTVDLAVFVCVCLALCVSAPSCSLYYSRTLDVTRGG